MNKTMLSNLIVVTENGVEYPFKIIDENGNK